VRLHSLPINRALLVQNGGALKDVVT
jgi:hypothetical protein